MSLERYLRPHSHQDALEWLSIADKSSFRIPDYILLTETPNVSFLNQLINIPNEVNIFQFKGQWFANRGRGDMVPDWAPPESAVVIHSHRLIGGKKEEQVDLPHQADLLSHSKTAKRFIISSKGLTIFTRPTRHPLWCKYLDEKELGEISWEMQKLELKEESREAIEQGSKKKYEEFLRNMGVCWELILWENLTDERLKEIWG